MYEETPFLKKILQFLELLFLYINCKKHDRFILCDFIHGVDDLLDSENIFTYIPISNEAPSRSAREHRRGEALAYSPPPSQATCNTLQKEMGSL